MTKREPMKELTASPRSVHEEFVGLARTNVIAAKLEGEEILLLSPDKASRLGDGP